MARRNSFLFRVLPELFQEASEVGKLSNKEKDDMIRQQIKKFLKTKSSRIQFGKRLMEIVGHMQVIGNVAAPEQATMLALATDEQLFEAYEQVRIGEK